MRRSELLRQIQAADFAAHDAALFLNTHPTDQKALEYYHKMMSQSKELTEQYTTMFGPLTRNAVKSTSHWDWINEPWPWERGE